MPIHPLGSRSYPGGDRILNGGNGGGDGSGGGFERVELLIYLFLLHCAVFRISALDTRVSGYPGFTGITRFKKCRVPVMVCIIVFYCANRLQLS
jgi:hypothetical protein